MGRKPSNNARNRFIAEMQREMPTLSPLGEYLTWMRQQGQEGADAAEILEADLIETFKTDFGLRVLKLFEKSVIDRGLPNGADERALREMNAVRNFVMEIRRIVSNG